jgi:hypothetical protein
MIDQPHQLGPIVQGAAGGVAEEPQATCGGQRVVLQAKLLLTRRNPRIAQ